VFHVSRFVVFIAAYRLPLTICRLPLAAYRLLLAAFY